MILRIHNATFTAESDADWDVLLKQRDEMGPEFEIVYDEQARTMTVTGEGHV